MELVNINSIRFCMVLYVFSHAFLCRNFHLLSYATPGMLFSAHLVLIAINEPTAFCLFLSSKAYVLLVVFCRQDITVSLWLTLLRVF